MLIAHISDPHIAVPSVDTDHGPNAVVYLERAVTHIRHLPVLPDVVLITGDCTDRGTPAEYNLLRTLLQPLSTPVYVIPGNHDNRVAMQQSFGAQGTQPLEGFVQYVVDTGPVRVIALDTHVPSSDAGYLGSEQLAWLEARLAEAPTHPTVICMHHPPFHTGLAVPDYIGLQNADEFGAIIARAPQVERILAGHLHMMMTQRFQGTIAMTCAATDYNLLPDSQHAKRFVVRKGSPMCLLHEWRATTGLVTQVSVIGDESPMIELHDGERWVA